MLATPFSHAISSKLISSTAILALPDKALSNFTPRFAGATSVSNSHSLMFSQKLQRKLLALPHYTTGVDPYLSENHSPPAPQQRLKQPPRKLLLSNCLAGQVDQGFLAHLLDLALASILIRL